MTFYDDSPDETYATACGETFRAYDTRQGADFFAHPGRIACLKLDLDFVEGEGL